MTGRTLAERRRRAGLRAYHAYVDSSFARMLSAARACERVGLLRLARALREHVRAEIEQWKAEERLGKQLTPFSEAYDEDERKRDGR